MERFIDHTLDVWVGTHLRSPSTTLSATPYVAVQFKLHGAECLTPAAVVAIHGYS